MSLMLMVVLLIQSTPRNMSRVDGKSNEKACRILFFIEHEIFYRYYVLVITLMLALKCTLINLRLVELENWAAFICSSAQFLLQTNQDGLTM